MRYLILVLALTVSAAGQIQEISGERIRAHVKFLSSDLLEGRGAGARGGQLATEYIAAQFALIGAKPAGDNGTYYQRAPLMGVEPRPDSQLSAVGKSTTLPLKWLEDFVGVNLRQTPVEAFEAEAVFAGHGIVAPEFQWDDFKGVDVRGKILVLFTNEPASTDEKFFGGRALTYYGRWTYKYEEATRRGALAVIIIHTTPTAGYGWNVVRNSWGREVLCQAEARRAGLGLRGLGDSGGRREARLHGRKDRSRITQNVGFSRFQAYPAGGPDAWQHPQPGP
jgi:hypothetical protein